MPEVYIPLDDAARFEDMKYRGMLSRIQRNPSSFKTQERPNANGGKPLKQVALSSLSSKARKAYKAAQKVIGGDALQLKAPNDNRPWYMNTDFHWYVENHQDEYYKAIELKNQIVEFLQYDDVGRTDHADEIAAQLGVSARSLYRYASDVTDANIWANIMEASTGKSHDYFAVLCLCRKPREKDEFPSLSQEIRAAIENIWFNEIFRQNLGTRQMLYDKIEERCKQSNVFLPSYQTVARYINSLMDKGNGQSAAYLAAKGLRDWKNQYMMKGERDLTQLEIMETVMGDEHTFDLFVSFVSSNGKVIAIRPKVIAWIDARSRKFVSYAVCRDANMQDIKNTVAKMGREYGMPKNVLIDNGTDYTGKEMTGHDRKDRMMLDAELQGYYKSMGIQNVYRSLPYQPWDKGAIERPFLTVCNKFSKWFKSYVGTLTGSKTSSKVKKDIPKMLERGELFTLEEFYNLFDNYVQNVYHQHVHRGLVDSGEKFTTPVTLFENADKYCKPAPPDSYIAMLLMKPKEVTVRTTGIQHNRGKYMCSDLTMHINKRINIRYMPDDDSVIFAFAEDGELIGEVPLAEKLNPHFYENLEQLGNHKSKQNHQLRETRDTLSEYRTPFEERAESENATPHLIGSVDLTIGKKPKNNAITLPINDKEYRQTMKSNTKKKTSQVNPFLDDLAEDALLELRKMAL